MSTTLMMDVVTSN